MKKLFSLTLIALFVIGLSACEKATPEPVKEMINPGDEINGMLFTSTDKGLRSPPLGILPSV